MPEVETKCPTEHRKVMLKLMGVFGSCNKFEKGALTEKFGGIGDIDNVYVKFKKHLRIANAYFTDRGFVPSNDQLAEYTAKIVLEEL